MSREPVFAVPLSIRQHLRAGLAGVIVLVGGVGGWAATTELAGAVIGSGTLVVDSYTKKVQHPTGGVVGELNVREGAKVKAGDVVVRLDETVTRANLLIVVKSLDEQAARQARLEAERDDEDRLDFPADLIARASDPDRSAGRKSRSRRKTVRPHSSTRNSWACANCFTRTWSRSRALRRLSATRRACTANAAL